jgi:hypothetical protein
MPWRTSGVAVAVSATSRVAQLRAHLAEARVVGTEVVPTDHAVRLVDGEQHWLRARQRLAEAGRTKRSGAT